MEIALVELPTERYKRNVVRGKLDLVGEFLKNKSFPVITRINERFLIVYISIHWWDYWFVCRRQLVKLCGDNLLFYNTSLLWEVTGASMKSCANCFLIAMQFKCLFQ